MKYGLSFHHQDAGLRRTWRMRRKRPGGTVSLSGTRVGSDAWVSVAAAAMRTERIRLGTISHPCHGCDRDGSLPARQRLWIIFRTGAYTLGRIGASPHRVCGVWRGHRPQSASRLLDEDWKS